MQLSDIMFLITLKLNAVFFYYGEQFMSYVNCFKCFTPKNLFELLMCTFAFNLYIIEEVEIILTESLIFISSKNSYNHF